MDNIKINGHFLERPLMIEDPDSRTAVRDASGRTRHISYCSTAEELKDYLGTHTEGFVAAGVGTIFFLKPFAVSFASVRFDYDGSADILVKEDAGGIEKQLTAMEEIREAAEFEICK